MQHQLQHTLLTSISATTVATASEPKRSTVFTIDDQFFANLSWQGWTEYSRYKMKIS